MKTSAEQHPKNLARDISPGTRQLTVSVLRHNPSDGESQPHFQHYQAQESESLTLYILLNHIREHQDASLQFDFVCRAGICGSCAMLVNGKPALACRTLTSQLPDTIVLAPLPGFELIGDLSVDTGKWMRGMSERLETWIHGIDEQYDLSAIEQPMEPEKAEEIYELERCIECGCCVAACATIQMRKDFAAAVGLMQIARFAIDPRDPRDDQAYYELVGDENGVFACMSMMGCEDYCPKSLPLAQQIAYLRRSMAKQGFKSS